VSVLKAEKRRYPVEQNETTEAAIYPTFWGDLYVVIGDADASTGGYVTRIYFNPLIGWIWAGVFIMVVGGLFSLSDRRHRVGAPVRHRRTTQHALGAAPAE
jgi:cytochrome c-type biogenesis protein CcmF